GVDRADGDPGDPMGRDARLLQLLIDARLIGAQRPAALQHQHPPLRPLLGRGRRPGLFRGGGPLRRGPLCRGSLRRGSAGPPRLRYCMNQPWLTTRDWPVSALLGKLAKSTATSATSWTVVNSPSTVSFSMIFLITSSSEMPKCWACSGICLSTSGVRTKPGQMTLARTPCSPPSFAIVLARPISPCLAVT